MAGVSVTNIAFPLSFTEATNHMTAAQRQCAVKAPANTANWWLRSPGDVVAWTRHIIGGTGVFSYNSVTSTYAVRPAL